MITGLPPFQSQSEWLIFKKIEKLDYTFQEGFNEEAKELIRSLLVIEPGDRLGARDRKSYDSLKSHPFFRGVDFDTLPDTTPPALTEMPELIDGDGPDPCWAREPDAKPGAGRLPMLMLRDAGCDSSSGSENGCGPLQILGRQTTSELAKSPPVSQDRGAEDIRKSGTKNYVLQSQNMSESERVILMAEQKIQQIQQVCRRTSNFKAR